MTYAKITRNAKVFRVKKGYENSEMPVLEPVRELFEGELYTLTEVNRLVIPDSCYKLVEVPKGRIYWFFGVRYDQKDRWEAEEEAQWLN